MLGVFARIALFVDSIPPAAGYWLAWHCSGEGQLLIPDLSPVLLAFLPLQLLQLTSFIMAAIPADGTWFDTLGKSFADVPIETAKEDAIPTADFLEAAEALVSLFGGYCSLTACWYKH